MLWFRSRNRKVKACLLIIWAVQAYWKAFIGPLKSTIEIFSPVSLYPQAAWQENRQNHGRITQRCLQATEDLRLSIQIPEWLSEQVNEVH